MYATACVCLRVCQCIHAWLLVRLFVCHHSSFSVCLCNSPRLSSIYDACCRYDCSWYLWLTHLSVPCCLFRSLISPSVLPKESRGGEGLGCTSPSLTLPPLPLSASYVQIVLPHIIALCPRTSLASISSRCLCHMCKKYGTQIKMIFAQSFILHLYVGQVTMNFLCQPNKEFLIHFSGEKKHNKKAYLDVHFILFFLDLQVCPFPRQISFYVFYSFLLCNGYVL